jgi:hypothetical protein
MAAFLLAPSSFAGICASTTSCTLTLNQGNASGGFGSGNFGTVTITLDTLTDIATVDVKLTAPGFYFVDAGGANGFPGIFGFDDNLGGGVTIGNSTIIAGADTGTALSGSISDTTNNLHWDGFGFSDDTADVNGPNSGHTTLTDVSFTVQKGTSLTDVNDLVNLFNPAGGDGPAFFVVDVFNSNTTGPGARGTGLIAATPVPEPGFYGALSLGLAGLWVIGQVRSRRVRRQQLG